MQESISLGLRHRAVTRLIIRICVCVYIHIERYIHKVTVRGIIHIKLSHTHVKSSVYQSVYTGALLLILYFVIF